MPTDLFCKQLAAKSSLKQRESSLLHVCNKGSKLYKRVEGGFFFKKIWYQNRLLITIPLQCLQSGDQLINKVFLFKSMLPTRNIFMYTDIQADSKSLKSLMASSKIVKECLDLVVDLTPYFTINLIRTCRQLIFKRNDIKTFVRVLTGHCLIGRCASRMRLPYNDYCTSQRSAVRCHGDCITYYLCKLLYFFTFKTQYY